MVRNFLPAFLALVARLIPADSNLSPSEKIMKVPIPAVVRSISRQRSTPLSRSPLCKFPSIRAVEKKRVYFISNHRLNSSILQFLPRIDDKTIHTPVVPKGFRFFLRIDDSSGFNILILGHRIGTGQIAFFYIITDNNCIHYFSFIFLSISSRKNCEV